MKSNLVRTLDDQPLLNPASGKVPVRLLAIVFAGVVIVGLILYLVLVVPTRRVLSDIRGLQAIGGQFSASLKSQDLGAAKNLLSQAETSLGQTRSDLRRMVWLKLVPVARNYYLDAENSLSAGQEILKSSDLAITAVAPYADVIGLKGLAGTGDGVKTAQDRITLMVNTLDKIKPQLSEIGGHLSAAKKYADNIDPNRYPENFRGTNLRSKISLGISLLDQAASLITDAQPLLESAPYMLGTSSPRRYLVLFQNDAELRPTGGFLTGYAVIEVNQGKINTVLSDDIYKLDEKFPKRITAPDPILKYMPLVPYWYLRDQNLSPDFKVSMDTFLPNYKLTGSPGVDGIIAVDTQVLVDLLRVTGPVGVPGFGNFSAENDPRCNCPQVFYQLQTIVGGEEAVVWDSVTGKIVQAPANYGNRKKFLGPVMYSILANVMAQPKSKFPLLFQTAINDIQQKHILLYYTDPTVQSAVESFNLAGRLTDSSDDYLLVVDTNFSGAKTNIWVTYTADVKVDVASDGTVTKTLTLNYSNPEDKSVVLETGRKLNGIFRDWLRVYVPRGSRLLEAKGFEIGQKTSEDLGKTVFEGFFTLSPTNVRTISLKYQIPVKMKSAYKTLIQKQGGSKTFSYTFTVNGHKHPELLLDSDKSLSYSL